MFVTSWVARLSSVFHVVIFSGADESINIIGALVQWGDIGAVNFDLI